MAFSRHYEERSNLYTQLTKSANHACTA